MARAVLLLWAAALFVVLAGSTRRLPTATDARPRGGGESTTDTENNPFPEMARLERSLDHGGRAALKGERARIAAATRKAMEDDSMKQKHARTGEWRRLKRPRNLTAAEEDGYRRADTAEESRLLRILAAQAPCGDRATCQSLALSEVGDELRTLRLNDIFASRAALSSDAAMRAAFGASAPNASAILLGG